MNEGRVFVFLTSLPFMMITHNIVQTRVSEAQKCDFTITIWRFANHFIDYRHDSHKIAALTFRFFAFPFQIKVDRSEGMWSWLQIFLRYVSTYTKLLRVCAVTNSWRYIILKGETLISSTDSRSSRNGHQLSSATSSRESPLLNSSQSRNVSMPPLLMKSASQSGAINHEPPMSEQEFTKTFNSVLKDFFAEPIVEVRFSSRGGKKKKLQVRFMGILIQVPHAP